MALVTGSAWKSLVLLHNISEDVCSLSGLDQPKYSRRMLTLLGIVNDQDETATSAKP